MVRSSTITWSKKNRHCRGLGLSPCPRFSRITKRSFLLLIYFASGEEFHLICFTKIDPKWNQHNYFPSITEVALMNCLMKCRHPWQSLVQELYVTRRFPVGMTHRLAAKLAENIKQLIHVFNRESSLRGLFWWHFQRYHGWRASCNTVRENMKRLEGLKNLITIGVFLGVVEPFRCSFCYSYWGNLKHFHKIFVLLLVNPVFLKLFLVRFE